jgi:hypothetical protein
MEAFEDSLSIPVEKSCSIADFPVSERDHGSKWQDKIRRITGSHLSRPSML